MKNKALFFFILFIFLKNTSLFSQDSTITITNLGPYDIGIFNKHKIVAEVKNLELINSSHPFDKGDIYFKVERLYGGILYEEKFQLDGGYMISVDVDTLFGNGTCLSVTKDFTAAPPYDRFSEYFCFNKNNEFIRITGEIYGDHEIKNITYKGKRISIIESHEWLDQFYVTFYYKFYLNGLFDQYDYIKQKKYKVTIDSLQAFRWRSEENRSIDLFQCADTNKCNSQKITINKNSKIKFLYATKNNNIWWLCVLINSKKGFVKGYKDLDTLGLPVAG